MAEAACSCVIGAVLLLAGALLVGACSGPAAPPIVPRDGAGRDAAPRDADETPGMEGPDGAVDAEVAQDAASDAGPLVPAACTVDPDDLIVVGRDGAPAGAAIATASTATDFVAVFSDDFDGTRRLRLARAPLEGPVARADLPDAPEGARAPSIARVGDGWLVVYEAGGGIEARAYSSAFAAAGPPSPIAASGASPHLVPLGPGAYVTWRDGALLMGRPLAASGTPTGAAVEVLALPSSSSGQALGALGTAGEALAAVGSTVGVAARATGRRILASGSPAPGTIAIGTTTEAEGAIALAGAAPSAPPRTEPLMGAAVFDVRVGGEFPAVRFVALQATGAPAFAEFTVSDAGERAWSGAVAGLRSGYVVAYRARPADGGLAMLRLAVLERDSCRLGRVDARSTIAGALSDEGGPPSVTVQGDRVFVAWADVVEGAIEYRVAVARCEGGGRS